jgi:hypothetical protein
VAGVLERVLECDVFFGALAVEDVGADGVSLDGGWGWGGRDGCLAGGGAVEGVFEDSCDSWLAGGRDEGRDNCGGVIVYLWASC